MKAMQFVVTATVFVGLAIPAVGQEQATTASSAGSIRAIPKSDQMFRKTIWRTIDLREKQNQPMFSQGKEISRVILDAVKRGELQAYRDETLTTTFTKSEMRNQTSQEDDAPAVPDDADANWGGGQAANVRPPVADDGWGPAEAPVAPVAAARTTRRARRDARGRIMRDRRGNTLYEQVAVAAPVAAAPPATNRIPYLPKELFQIELKENMIFDKKRSRMYHEIQTITLQIPASKNKKSVDLPVATFKYSDLVKVFRNNPQDAIWFNAQNDAQHKNLADAFELWLFNAYITKVSNPNDSALADVYGGGEQGILAAQQTASELVEYEYNLWSF